jgi:Tfp pilus assembly protein PilN
MNPAETSQFFAQFWILYYGLGGAGVLAAWGILVIVASWKIRRRVRRERELQEHVALWDDAFEQAAATFKPKLDGTH